MSEKKYTLQTLSTRAGVETDPQYGAVVPPLHLSTNYTFEEVGKRRLYDYARSGNPTRGLLEQAIADLEGGAGAAVTCSGMSALTTLFHLLKSGDTLMAPHDCYGGTHRLLQSLQEKNFLKVVFVNQSDRDNLQAAFETHKPHMVLIETPSNPLLRIADIEYICELAKKHDCISAADNTFLSPVLQQPLSLGADIVMHSNTKFINGHGDVVGGALVGKTQEMAEKLQWWANNLGTTGSSFDSYLTLRGSRTMPLRVKEQAGAAEKIANFLHDHDKVEKVYYPGLSSHEGHDLAARQQKGFGSMLSFEIQGGANEVKTLVDHLELFSLAESLGGFESLIAHPPTMTHAAMDADARVNAGINDNLMRLSIGLEDPDDLIDDLRTALNAL